jgi:hypothetical protein
MLTPLRLVLEADAPKLRAGKECAQLLGRVVDGVRRNQIRQFVRFGFARAVPAPPRHEPRHVVARDLGQELVLAKKLNQQREPVLGAIRPGVMLPDLLPVALGHIVELERGLGRRQLRDQPLRLLALGRLYFFGFAARRAFRRAVKPMTSDLEVEVPIWRARAAIERHAGESLRV